MSLKDVLVIKIHNYYGGWGMGKKAGYSTINGYVNDNEQKNMGRLEERGTDFGQWFYQMECQKCGALYKSNGTDIHQRKCPNCQGGRE